MSPRPHSHHRSHPRPHPHPHPRLLHHFYWLLNYQYRSDP